MRIALCVFDAYGTLFDVGAAARRAAGEPGREAFAARAGELAELWRRKQLEYTWLRAAAGVHTDFWSVTLDALDHALEATGLAGPEHPELRARLAELYRGLDAYPEVPAVLDALRADGRARAILSNASPAMLEAAAASARIADRLDALISVESAGVFKPARAAYELVCPRFALARREVLFVSSNAWDAWAATAFGFRTVWVNRRGEAADRLTVAPERVARDLSEVPAIAAELSGGG